MREIKFRAWNENEKKMEVVTSIQFWGTDGGVKDVNWGLWVCPLMEFTGLLDKNGKEIYEGDILKGLLDHIDVVKWHETISGFSPLCIYDSDCGDEYEIKFCEVIGNIYENAELLK